MKKLMLSLAVFATAAFTFSALADTVPATPAACCTAEGADCKTAKECRKADRKECRKGPKHNKKGRKEARRDLFEGITLSADQQKAIDSLRTERRAARKADKAACKTDKAKVDQAFNNEASRKARKEACKEARKARRAEFSAKVKAILTPEQYARFEKNLENAKQFKQQKRFDKKAD